MSYISDKKIKKLVKNKNLIIPFYRCHLNPCSYDLTLDKREFLFPLAEDLPINPHVPVILYDKRSSYQTIKSGKGDFIIISADHDNPVLLRPGEFCLASTVEKVNIPENYAAQVIGKSSIGRCGLFIHNAGHIDPGFKGNITLELYNAGANIINLSSIERVCQIVFIPIKGKTQNSYDGKYQNQSKVTAPRRERDYKINED